MFTQKDLEKVLEKEPTLDKEFGLNYTGSQKTTFGPVEIEEINDCIE